MEKPQLSVWGVIENAIWDIIKWIWWNFIPHSWKETIVPIVGSVLEWLAAGSWLTIVGVAAFGMFLVNQFYLWRTLPQLHSPISPDLESRQKFQIGTQEKVKPAVYQNKLTIDYAGYGLGFSSYCDVTEDVRKLMQDNQLRVYVETGLFSIPDPYENREKHLVVIYSHGNYRGKKKTMIEHGLIELPER